MAVTVGDLESTAVAVFLENLAGDLTQFRNALHNNYSSSGHSHSSFPATLQEAYEKRICDSEIENASITDAPSDEIENSDVEVCDSETENASITDAPSDELCNNGGDSVLPPPQEAEPVARQHGYNLRPTKARDYTHLGHTQFYRTLVTNLLSLTQMSFKKDLCKHGMDARKAMLKEFAQIKGKEVFSPIKASSLTPTKRRKALRTINLIKEKRDGVLKGHTCVDGRPQRLYIAKEDASSPTMFLDSLTTLLTIFAVEERHIATADVSGAYLHADMDEVVFIKLEDEMVDVFCELDSQYKAYVSLEKNKRVLYLRLNKALYGCGSRRSVMV